LQQTVDNCSLQEKELSRLSELEQLKQKHSQSILNLSEEVDMWRHKHASLSKEHAILKSKNSEFSDK